MRILYFHQYFRTPKVGGGTRSYEWARRLVAKGHQVTVITGSGAFGGGYEPSEIQGSTRRGKIEGIDIIEFAIPYRNDFNVLQRAWAFVQFALLSIKFALREPANLVFATSTPLTAALPGIAASWFRPGMPFVFEIRDPWPEVPRAMGGVPQPVLWAMDHLETLAYRTAQGCIGLSPGMIRTIRRKSSPTLPVAMVPNASDTQFFHPAETPPPPLEGFRPDDFVAIYTGAHGLANGLDAVLDAAQELKDRGRTDIHFVFLGDGKQKPSLQARTECDHLSNCHFLPPRPKSQVAEILRQVQVGLLIFDAIPVFYEGTSPNKCFDYLASGLPVLNNYPGWLARKITTHDCGIVVPPGDAVAFADALEQMADDRHQLRKQGRNARKLAEAEFDRDLLFTRWHQLLTDAAKEPAP